MFGPPVQRKTREMDWRDDTRTFNPSAAAVGPTFGRSSRGQLRFYRIFFRFFFFLHEFDPVNDIPLDADRRFYFIDAVRTFMIIYSVC